MDYFAPDHFRADRDQFGTADRAFAFLIAQGIHMNDSGLDVLKLLLQSRFLLSLVCRHIDDFGFNYLCGRLRFKT